MADSTQNKLKSNKLGKLYEIRHLAREIWSAPILCTKGYESSGCVRLVWFSGFFSKFCCAPSAFVVASAFAFSLRGRWSPFVEFRPTSEGSRKLI